MWAYPEATEEEEEPHLSEAMDKKLQLIMINAISDRETKSLSSFMEEHKYPATEAWKYFMIETHTSRYHAERITKEKFNQPVRTKNPAEFVKFCDEIEAQIIALKQAGVRDPLTEYDAFFTRAALHALPKGGEGEWMTSKIRLEGNDWNWKEMKRRMKESLELTEELRPASLYVPKGNPTRVSYGKFKPRLNRLRETDNTSEQSEEMNENSFEAELGNMTDGEFDQYIGQICAVRKGAGKGRNPKESGKGATGDKCGICGRPGHVPANCPGQPRAITKAFNDYFVDKKCHACQAVGHGWRQCLNLYAKLRHGTKVESDPNPPGYLKNLRKS